MTPPRPPVRRSLRRALLRAADSPPATAAVNLLDRVERSVLRGPDRLAILTYHRVDSTDPAERLLPSLRSTDPDTFAAHIDHLAARFRFLSLQELLDLRRSGDPPPKRSLVLTFDDAYRDLATNAWPVLRARRLAAICFVPTGFVDTDQTFWWDAAHQSVMQTGERSLPWRGERLDVADHSARHHASRRVRADVKQLPHSEAMAAVEQLVRSSGVSVDPAPVLGWDQLRRLHGEGLAIAPHTRSHALLDRVSPSRAVAEIEGAMADIHAEIGECPPVFAYPSGQVDSTAREAVASAGIEIAMTTRRGVNQVPPADWLQLERINVGAGAGPTALHAQLLRSSEPVVARLR